MRFWCECSMHELRIRIEIFFFVLFSGHWLIWSRMLVIPPDGINNQFLIIVSAVNVIAVTIKRFRFIRNSTSHL